MIARFALIVLAAFAGLAAIAYAQQPQNTSVLVSDNTYTPSKATIALGGICDSHAEMVGVITATNADGSLPADATPTPTATPQPRGSAQPTPTPGGGQETQNAAPGPSSAAKATIAASQRGNAVAGSLKGGTGRATVTIEALAKRSDLKAKGKAKLVRVGKVATTVAAGATAKFSIPLNAKAKAALKRLRKLKLTVNVTVAGKTQARSVTLQVK